MNKVFILYTIIILNFTSCSVPYFANREEAIFTKNFDSITYNTSPLPFDIAYKWKLETIRADADESFMKIMSKDKTPTLSINDDSRVSGYDGCNRFSSKIIVYNNNNIRFLVFLATNRGCHSDVYWHSKFYKAISSINNYEILNEKLLLKKNSDILLIFSKN